MRAFLILPLLSIPASILAVPTNEFQQVFSDLAANANFVQGGISGQIPKSMEYTVHRIGSALSNGKEHVKSWVRDGKEFIQQNGLTYELVKHSLLSDYSLRVTEPGLCDTSVKQYSGYLDISDGKHLFFWFFESRGNPEKDPLVLWLNGGPGCSSSTGLLFELGPCRITNDGLNTTYNPLSWNEHANIIFLDQPVNVGYSYSSDGSTVSTSPVAGQDVYAFLELFISRFAKYADLPFHLVAESYGGTYGPNIASIIHQKNQALAFAPTPGLRPINLASLILANGLTDPYYQLPSIVDYACEGPYPVYSDPEGPECKSLRTKVPTCQRMVKACYNFSSRLTCVPAAVYCYAQIFRPIQQTGVNPYDVRKTCDPSEDGDMCYREIGWIDTWMNDPKVKAELGVDPTREFESCSEKVNQAFWLQGDGMHNSAALLPELINDGIRLLVYAGNADAACNFMGNERWLSELDHKFHKEFAVSKSTQWITTGSGRVAGEVRSAGGGGFGAGNVTFVNIYEAGHMAAFDQPEAALDMFTRWISDVSLTAN